MNRLHELVRSRWLAALLVVLGLAIAIGRVGLASVREAGPASAHWVMTDFYSSAYYPVRALLDGENPHDQGRLLELYPVEDQYAPYLPLNLVLHLPFGLLPPQLAGFAYFLFTLALTFALAIAALRLSGVPLDGPRVCLVAGCLLLSRPGQWTLLLGQQAMLLALLVYITFMLADRSPWWSAVALAVASYKPTYGVPLGILLLLAGRYRVAIAGGLIAAIGNAPLLLLLIERAGGLSSLLAQISAGYEKWQLRAVANPATSPWLVDAPSLVSRLNGEPMALPAQVALGLGILAVAAFTVRRLRWHDRVERNLALGIICTALLAAAHHVGYDMVLLTAPAVALATGGLPAGMPRPLRWAIVLSFLLPALNWIATYGVLKALDPPRPVWLLLTAINSTCILVLFAGFVGLALVERRPAPAHPGLGVAR